MSIFLNILKVILEVASGFFRKEMETPAIKETTDVQEGDLPMPTINDIADRHGLYDRDED